MCYMHVHSSMSDNELTVSVTCSMRYSKENHKEGPKVELYARELVTNQLVTCRLPSYTSEV